MSAELANHGYDISPGTLYPTLHRMEKDGLLVSSKSIVDGRTLRTYTATDKGLTALRDGQRAVRELANEVLPTKAPAGESGTSHANG